MNTTLYFMYRVICEKFTLLKYYGPIYLWLKVSRGGEHGRGLRRVNARGWGEANCFLENG